MKYLCSLRTATMALSLFAWHASSAQCTDQVTHLSGTQIIAGTDVTVTSADTVDTNTSYCTETFPYFIGYSYSLNTSGSGSYTFAFDPPIASARFNVSGISQDPSNAEEVWVFVNGAHYAIPAPGQPQVCDPMAVLTAAGNIAGCNPCGVSGWANTTVPGPITTLTLLDTALFGEPAGAIFSLFICPGEPQGIAAVIDRAGLPYPDPATDRFSLPLSDPGSTVRLLDALGRAVTVPKEHQPAMVVFNTSSLPRGLYTVEVWNKQQRSAYRVVLE